MLKYLKHKKLFRFLIHLADNTDSFCKFLKTLIKTKKHDKHVK
jgi:hypothetical protein